MENPAPKDQPLGKIKTHGPNRVPNRFEEMFSIPPSITAAFYSICGLPFYHTIPIIERRFVSKDHISGFLT